MNDLIDGVRLEGEVRIDNEDILGGNFDDLVRLRKK